MTPYLFILTCMWILRILGKVRNISVAIFGNTSEPVFSQMAPFQAVASPPRSRTCTYFRNSTLLEFWDTICIYEGHWWCAGQLTHSCELYLEITKHVVGREVCYLCIAFTFVGTVGLDNIPGDIFLFHYIILNDVGSAMCFHRCIDRIFTIAYFRYTWSFLHPHTCSKFYICNIFVHILIKLCNISYFFFLLPQGY